MESKEKKAIQCQKPVLLTRGDLLVQDNASLHTVYTTTALLYTRYWKHVPIQSQGQPPWTSMIWKMAENHLLGHQEMRSRSGFESRLRKSHHMLQVLEQEWWLCGQVKDWCPHTTMCFKSTGLKKNRETQFLTSLNVWWVLVVI